MKHIVLRFAKKIDKYISHWNVKKCQQFYISHVKSTHHSPDISWHPVSNNVMQPFIFLQMHFLLPFWPKSNTIRIKLKLITVFRVETVGLQSTDRSTADVHCTPYSQRKLLCAALHIPANALFIAFFTTIFGQSNTIRI